MGLKTKCLSSVSHMGAGMRASGQVGKQGGGEAGKQASGQVGTQASRQAGKAGRRAGRRAGGQAYSFSRMVLYCQFSKQGYGRVYQLSEVLFFMGCLHLTKCSTCTPRSHEHKHNSLKYKPKSYTQRSSYMYRSTLPHLMSPPPPPPCKDKKFHIR